MERIFLTKETDEEEKWDSPINKEDYYNIVKPLRTYERDISETLRKKETSKIDILLGEQKRPPEENKPVRIKFQEDIAPKDNKRFKKIALTILFFILLAFVIWFVNSTLGSKSKEIPIEKSNTPLPIIFVQTNNFINISVTDQNRNQLLEQINQDILKNEPELGNIVLINLIDNSLGQEIGFKSDKFLSLMTPGIPQTLLRSLDQKFNYGYISTTFGYIPFLIIKINSFNNVFAGMLEWEKIMSLSLRGFITPDVNLENLTFEDQRRIKKDIRVLYGPDNKEIVVYSFIERDTLIITRDFATFEDVLQKYTDI